MWNLGSSSQFVLLVFITTLVCCTCRGAMAVQQHEYRLVFARELLLSLRSSTEGEIPITIPAEIFVPLHIDQNPPRRPPRRKRGRRGGIKRRVKKFCLDDRRRLPPLPSVFLSNAQSLRRNIDELESLVKLRPEIKECCLLGITETWLNESDLDNDMALTGFGCPIRLDRSRETTGKSRGGGVCFYVNQRYYKIIHVREKICTPDIELLTISLRPFYIPREFPQLFFTLMYCHPRANAIAATQVIMDLSQRLDTICSDAPKFYMGDMNHVRLDKVLRTYDQYVTCITTRRNTTLDLCFGNVKEGYKSLLMPGLGASYHNSIFLVPTYEPCIRRREGELKTVKLWTEDSISSLQACFECTDWKCFFDGCGDNIDELSDTVSSYVTFCVDTVIPVKTVITFPNNKPWVTKDLKTVINKKKRIFFTGDPVERKSVSREVRAEIVKAKSKYRENIEKQYVNGDLRAAWRGIKSMATINQYGNEPKQQISLNSVQDDCLPDVFNTFFLRFETSDFMHEVSRV